MTDWRSIPAHDIDWYITGISRAASHRLNGLCRVVPEHQIYGEWSSLTLGEIADIGIAKWYRATDFGTKCEQILSTIIDMAAEGQKVALHGKARDAYVPKCERPSL